MILIKKINSSESENIILENINPDEVNKICQIYSKTLPSDAIPNFGFDALKKYFLYLIENEEDIITSDKSKHQFIEFLFDILCCFIPKSLVK